MNRSNIDEAGFTLVEALVAFAVLVLSLAALYQIYGSSLANEQREALRQEALQIAQNRLAEIGVEDITALAEELVEPVGNGRLEVRTRMLKPREGSISSTIDGVWITIEVIEPGTSTAPLVQLTTFKLAGAP